MENIKYTEVIIIDDSISGEARTNIIHALENYATSIDGQFYLKSLKETHGADKITISHADAYIGYAIRSGTINNLENVNIIFRVGPT